MKPQPSDQQGLVATLWVALRRPMLPRHPGFLAFGWLILFLLAVQLVSGVLLSVYYQPTADMAAESVRYIMRDVSWGWLMRGVHHWAPYGMIVLGLALMLRSVLQGEYRGAGRAHWWLGLVIFILIGLSTITGDILVWDAGAYRSAIFMLEKTESLPLVGEVLTDLVRGGEEVSPGTLSRFYSAHVFLLPWFGLTLILTNLWFLARRSRSSRRS